MNSFRGSYTVMVTPFTTDGQAVDDAALVRFVEWQITAGTQGLIALGSAGEFLSLTPEERTRVAELVIRTSGGRVPVLIGTAAEWTDEVVRYSLEAEKLGADGVMVVPPFYSSPSEDELFEHYRRIGEAIQIPVMVYNNPNTANVDLRPDFLARLSEIDTVRLIKESSGDVTRVHNIMRLCGERMTVFAGYHPWEAFLIGAEGYVSVFSNVAPHLSRELFEMTVDQGERERSRQLYYRVLPLIEAIADDLYVSATKAALELIGQKVGPPRPPRLPLRDEHRRLLKQVLGDLDLVGNQAG